MEPLVYNPFSFEVQHNPYPIYQRLRDEAPVYHDEALGFWALTRYEDVIRGHMMPRQLISGNGVTLEGGELGQPILILKDSPEHEWHRRVVSRYFTPKYVSGLEPYVREVAAEKLDPFVGAGGFDVVEDFSIQLPLQVTSELFSIPEEHRQAIHHLSDRIATRDDSGSVTPDAVEAMAGMWGILHDLVVERRKAPGEDLISVMITTPVVDDAGKETFLSDEELAHRFLELAFAGHETVARLIPNGVTALTWYPDQRRELVADPSLMPNAIEEMLRWDAPSHYQGRWSTEDLEFHGVTIPKDSRVILVTGAANHDEREFGENAALFDIHRTIERHISFGFGVHLCLGAHLARLESRVAFEELLARFPEWELDEPNIVRMRSSNVRGIACLPIKTS